MADATAKSPDRIPLIVGVGLLAIAIVVYWDASTISVASTIYGMGPKTIPQIIAGFIAALGLAHLIVAFRGGFGVEADPVDPVAVGWIIGGLVILIASIPLNIGFIPAMTALFACTARAFGRKAYAVDVGIGFVTAAIIYLVFTKLLTLGLPQGPLEKLIG